MTDALANLSLKVPEPSSDTMGKLAFLPAICSRKNPIDLTAGTNPESYERTLRVLAESDDFDALVAIFIPPAFQKSEMITEAVLHVTRTISKPVVACFMAGDLVREAVEALENGGVPNFPTVRRTAKAVWALVQRGRFLNTVAHQSECKVH